MGRFIDYTGVRLGKLLVLHKSPEPVGKNKAVGWVCLCDCGQEKVLAAARLALVRSCGCGQWSGATKHGMCGSLTYTRWDGMWSRVRDVENYKDRTPPDKWKTFEGFFEDMGECPKGYSLKRVDNNKPYGKDNCKWIPRGEQLKNTGRTVWVRMLTGELLCLSDAAKLSGINYQTVKSRIFAGWTIKAALNNLGDVTSFSLDEYHTKKGQQ